MKTKIYLGLALILTFSLMLAGAYRVTFAAGDYDYFRLVTINSSEVPETFTNFPILITGTYAELATTGNGGNIENTVATGGASGNLTVPADLDVGTAAGCDTGLDFEYEDYDATTGQITLWVEIPTLSHTADTEIYICYGDSSTTTNQENITGVWNSDYVAVYHMHDSVTDSTSNGLDGSDFASDGDAAGQVARALSFDGTDDYWSVADTAALDITGDITLSAWVYFDTLTGSIKTILSKGGPGGYDMQAFPAWDLDTNTYFDSTDHRSIDSINDHSWTIQEWHNLALTYSDSNNRFEWWHDGVSDGSQATSATLGTTADNLEIGKQPSNSRYHEGRIDEIRISDIERSDNWLLMEYTSINSGTLVTVSSEYEAGGPPILMGDPSLSLPAGLETAVETALNTYRPDSEIGLDPVDRSNMWAVSDYSETGATDYYWFSLVGMVVPDTNDTDTWGMEYSLWAGKGIALDNGGGSFTAHVKGSSGYDTMLTTAGLTDHTSDQQAAPGSASHYFPWLAGYRAYYGTAGIHGAGSATGGGGYGWKAVDYVGGATGFPSDIMPNAVYASQSGRLERICKDDVQVWVRIGNYLYGHLVDNASLTEGAYFSQGDYIGAIVTGTYLTEAAATYDNCPYADYPYPGCVCGYMCNGPQNYHLHWGFKYSGDYFQIENYILDMNSGVFSAYNGTTINTGGYLLAQWQGGPQFTPVPTITPGGPTVTPGGPTATPGTRLYDNAAGGGGHIWDSFIAGAWNVVNKQLNQISDNLGLQEGQLPRTYINTALSGIRVGISVFYLLLRSQLDMRITIFTIVFILVVLPLFWLADVWQWVKNKIPFIG